MELRLRQRLVPKAFAALVVLAALALIGSNANAGRTAGLAQRSYTLVDLGKTLGGTSEASAVNASGQVVGLASSRAFVYAKGRFSILGTLGGDLSTAHDNNDRGDVVGEADLAGGITHAFLYRRGAMHDLGTLGGEAELALALAINNRGQVVGATSLGDRLHPFLYSGGRMVDLSTRGLPLRGFRTVPRDINESGQVVGDFDLGLNDPREHAFLFRHGQTRDLGTLGGSDSSATAINDSGTVVGAASLTGAGFLGPFHAFAYRHGTMRDLGTLGGDESSALDVNEAGDVVGYATTAAGAQHAFLSHDGQMTDLNDLLPAGSDATLSFAAGINNRGQIVGDMLVDGDLHAFLMSPRSGS